MNTNERSKSPVVFFAWLILISLPFWLMGVFVEHFMPSDVPINLPVSALMTFNPMIVAFVLIYRRNGLDGVRTLVKRLFDLGRIPHRIWLAPVFLMMPLVMILVYGLMLLIGKTIPDPEVPILRAPILFAVFFLTAVGEEMGWMGYVFEPLQARWNALSVGIMLGVMWAVWHIVPYIQTHNSASWIFWQCVATVGLRVLIVWLYQNTGQSLFVAICFHTMINVSSFLFPNYGSYYDPFLTSIILWLLISMIVILWLPKTLTQRRFQTSLSS